MGWIRFRRGHERWKERLHSYADGELSVRDDLAFRAHLQECTECQAELTAVRELKTALQALPEAEPPRSFRLTPEMVAPARPVRGPQTPRWLPRVAQVAGGLSMAGFAALLAVDLFAMGSSTSNDDGGASLMAAQAPEDSSTERSFQNAANSTEPTESPAALTEQTAPNSTPVPSYTPGGASAAGTAEDTGTPVPPATGPGIGSEYRTTPAGAATPSDAQNPSTPSAKDPAAAAPAADAADDSVVTISAPRQEAESKTDKRLLRSMEAVLASIGVSALALAFLAKKSVRS